METNISTSNNLNKELISREVPAFKEIVVTLYENHYDLGVGSLINSLFKTGFVGLVYIGYRGKLPVWYNQLEKYNDEYYHLDNKIFVKYDLLDIDMHFGYYKFTCLKQVLEIYQSAKKIFYFDPDIVLHTEWAFFSNWLESGISLNLDNCFHFVHHNHPWRKEWIRVAAADEKLYNPVDYYVNGGFMGLKRENSIFLDRLIACTLRFKEVENGNLNGYIKDGHRAFKTDQDILNAVITTSADLTFSIMGKEGMSFTQPGYLMSHAVHFVKPWKKNFLLNVIKYGQKPDIPEQNYFNYFDSPIQVFSPKTLKLKKINLKLASILGRLIG